MSELTIFVPDELHSDTKALVGTFAAALAEKLHAAEKKYGYSNKWAEPGWMDECRAKLIEHVHKGDPRDVAAYCAFLWFHNARCELEDQFIYDVTGKWPTKPARGWQRARPSRVSGGDRNRLRLPDAAYIAACSPDVVLRLIAVARAATAHFGAVDDRARACDSGEWLALSIAALDTESALRSALAELDAQQEPT